MAFPYAPQPVPSWWPVYGAVNVFGSLAIAGFFQGLAAGNPNTDAFTIGLVVKMTLVPVLDVLAYRDLYDRVPTWARIPTKVVAPVAVPVATPASLSVEPERVPPPPADEVAPPPIPPPPED